MNLREHVGIGVYIDRSESEDMLVNWALRDWWFSVTRLKGGIYRKTIHWITIL